jgi:ABC-type molybdate transport system ATPase subunit
MEGTLGDAGSRAIEAPAQRRREIGALQQNARLFAKLRKMRPCRYREMLG